VQPDEADPLRLLASAARQAPWLLEQSRPARGKWVGYLLVVHDGRGIPDPRTLARCLVHLTNHPIVANLRLPPLVFVVLYRVPFDAAKGWRRERRGVYLTNLGLAALIGGLGLAIGYDRVAVVQLPIMVIASIIGVWLFSIQHRFEHAQWMPETSWSFAEASLGGTSYLCLPPLLQWFTGNIGFHHVDPRIPNYRLEECHNADAGFQSASTLTLRTALRIVGQ
jgi:acyl-lipid omega-6 desaturase (Delta-12 desaturase)